jgi:ABC-type transport system involved in cytochrome c biogenesis permease subunit
MHSFAGGSQPMSEPRYIPWIGVGLAVVWLVTAAVPPADPEGQMRLNAFGRLPILERGRVKPIDTLARINLMIISGAQTYRDEKGESHSAVRWLLDVMTSSMKDHPDSPSRKRRAFRIEDEKVVSMLKLQSQSDDLYSAAEIMDPQNGPALKELLNQAMQLRAAQRRKPTAAEEELTEWISQLQIYLRFAEFETTHKVFRIDNDQVRDLLLLKPRSGFRYGFDEFLPRIFQLMREGDRARNVNEKLRSVFDVKVLEFNRHVELQLNLARLELDSLRVFPPDSSEKEWPALRTEAELKASPTANSFLRLLSDYADGKTEAFNTELNSYEEMVAKRLPGEVATARLEVFFNHFAPFYHCSILYVFVGLLACFSWVAYREPLNRAAFWLAVVTLVLHLVALLIRMHIQGRPPVTNLYSSAIFIGLGALALALVLEGIYRNSLGNIVASVIGASTMFVAHYLASDGDTLEMMQAVLDTNFWLATHVVCVTLGYTATLVAWMLGILFVMLGVCTPALDRKLFRSLGEMTYGVICFATFLSFVGTVLGGIWADQSWGRFWGWDPKENGALLIVLINILILHARWAGMVKQRGIAILAIVGGMVTGWSWFGTNQLGVGLHAYGFNNKLALGLTIFWITNLAFIAIGLVPTQHWKSFGRSAPEGSQLPVERPRPARGSSAVRA